VSIFPTKVLLATDGSGDAELAATTATSLAKSTGSELHVVHVWRPVPSVHFDALIRQEMGREAQEILDAQVKKVEGLGATVAEGHLREGDASEEIITLAAEIGYIQPPKSDIRWSRHPTGHLGCRRGGTERSGWNQGGQGVQHHLLRYPS